MTTNRQGNEFNGAIWAMYLEREKKNEGEKKIWVGRKWAICNGRRRRKKIVNEDLQVCNADLYIFVFQI